MAGIRGKDTKPEMVVRRGLHRAGFRFRLHDRRLPGKPDLVLPKYGAVILVHGCFWHGHDCALFKWPKTRVEFWREKIGRNRLRDEDTRARLLEAGWRLLEIWECALKGPERMDPEEVLRRSAAWIRGRRRSFTIRG